MNRKLEGRDTKFPCLFTYNCMDGWGGEASRKELC